MRSYVLAAVVIVAITAIKVLVGGTIAADEDVLYLAGIVLVASRFGAKPAGLAVATAAVAQAFVFLPRQHLPAEQIAVAVVSWTAEGALLCIMWNALDRARHRALVKADEANGNAALVQQLFDRSPIPMFVIDEASERLVAANEATSTLYGRSHEELLTLKLGDLAVEGETSGSHARHRGPDGKVLDLELATGPFTFEARPARIIAAQDVTQKNRLEEQLNQAQKMDAVGRLAGGVAHDFNNLLSIILGFSSVILEELPPESDLAEPIGEIKRAAERSAELTKQLLTFSRQKVHQTKVVDFNEAVLSMEKMLRRLVGEDVEVMVTPSVVDCRALMDQGQLEQVVMNLAVNARDAMPKGGELSIAVERRDVNGVDSVVVSVTDTGTGMDEATKAHIFEPFFTTKETGKGTGLGLSIVFGLVNKSGGHIEVKSTVGKGTTFEISLPATEDELSSGRVSTPSIAAPRQARAPVAASLGVDARDAGGPSLIKEVACASGTRRHPGSHRTSASATSRSRRP